MKWRMFGHVWRIYNYIGLPRNMCTLQPNEQQPYALLAQLKCLDINNSIEQSIVLGINSNKCQIEHL